MLAGPNGAGKSTFYEPGHGGEPSCILLGDAGIGNSSLRTASKEVVRIRDASWFMG